jgi:hypothetical protein
VYVNRLYIYGSNYFFLVAETKKSKTTFKDLEPIKATECNLLDAASQGAVSAAALVSKSPESSFLKGGLGANFAKCQW